MTAKNPKPGRPDFFSYGEFEATVSGDDVQVDGPDDFFELTGKNPVWDEVLRLAHRAYLAGRKQAQREIREAIGAAPSE